LTLIAAAIFCALPLFPSLTVREYRAGRLLWARPIAAGEEFSVRYTHSVNLSPVTDTLQWTGEELILRSSLFTSFGAGMPVLADGIGSELHNTPDGFLITGIDRAQPDNAIPIMLQAVPDHHLIFRGEEVSLRSLAGEEAFIKLGAEKLSLMTRLAARAAATP